MGRSLLYLPQIDAGADGLCVRLACSETATTVCLIERRDAITVPGFRTVTQGYQFYYAYRRCHGIVRAYFHAALIKSYVRGLI